MEWFAMFLSDDEIGLLNPHPKKGIKPIAASFWVRCGENKRGKRISRAQSGREEQVPVPYIHAADLLALSLSL